MKNDLLPMMRMEIVFPGSRKIAAKFRDFEVMTDQTLYQGGDNTAPARFKLFLVSLGTYVGIFIKSFCLQ
jgi:hypothetical protein